MKIFLFMLPALFFAQAVAAQIYVDSVRLDESKTGHYLIASRKWDRKAKQTGFIIDCAGMDKPKQLTTAQGEPLLFPTLATAFEFFYQHGWKFSKDLTVFSGSGDSLTADTDYLFERRE